MGRGSTTLKGPSSQDSARSWPANVNAIHTMAKTLTHAGETLNLESYRGGSPQCFAEAAVGRGSTMLKGLPWLAGPSEVVAAAHAKAIHTMA